MFPRMTRIKTLDMRLLDEVFEMKDGYVLNFNDRTFAEFFGGELSVDIEDRKYYANGSSKAKRLRTHLQTDPAPVVQDAAGPVGLPRCNPGPFR